MAMQILEEVNDFRTQRLTWESLGSLKTPGKVARGIML